MSFLSTAMRAAVACLLCVAVFGHVEAADYSNGLDDWGPEQVRKFLQDGGVKVKLEDLAASEMEDGHSLLLSDEDDLIKLGLKPADRLKILKAIESKRAAIEKAPVDVFEWRAANLRLTDFWIFPLLTLSPRASLIWARFVDKNNAIEKVNNEIDEIPDLDFWVTWIIAPSYPLYTIAKKFNSHTYVDEVLELSFLAKLVSEGVDILIHLYELKVVTWLGTRIVELSTAGVVANVMYYGLFYVLPQSLAGVFFHVYINFVLPLFCLLMWIGVAIAVSRLFVKQAAGGELATAKAKQD